MRSGSPSETKLSKTFNDGRIYPSPKVKLPFEHPEWIASHTIGITDPDDIFVASYLRHDRRLHALFRRYINQIQYGCKDPNCNTSTCLSCRRRLTKTPLRKYTALSARTLACHLLSQKDPEAALCWNEPVVPCDDEAEWPSRQSQPRRKKHSHQSEDTLTNGHANGHASASLRKGRMTNGHVKPLRPQRNSSDDSVPSTQGHEPIPLRYTTAIIVPPASSAPKPEVKKDPKSFTQSLFDTLPLRLLQWVPRHRTRSTSASASHANESGDGVQGETMSPASSQKETDMDSPDQENAAKEEEDSRAEQPTQSTVRINDIRPVRTPTNGSSPAVDGIIDQETESTYPLANGHVKSPPIEGRLAKIASQNGLSANGQVLEPVAGSDSPTAIDANIDTNPEGPGTKPEEASLAFDSEGFQNNPEPTLEWLDKISLLWMRDRRKEIHDERAGAGVEEFDPANWVELSRYIDQSVFYGLKDPDRLARSLECWHRPPFLPHAPDSSYPYSFKFDAGLMMEYFRCLRKVEMYEVVLRHLRRSLQSGYSPPGWAQGLQRHKKTPKSSSHGKKLSKPKDESLRRSGQPYIDDWRLSYVCVISLFALTYLICPYRLQTARAYFSTFEENSSWCFPTSFVERWRLGGGRSRTGKGIRRLLETVDTFDDWDANRLVEGLFDLVSTRLAFSEMSKGRIHIEGGRSIVEGKKSNLVELIVHHLKKSNVDDPYADAGSPSCNVAIFATIEWCRHFFRQNWDGNAVVRRAGPLGGALQILATMYKDHEELGLSPKIFQMDFVADKLDQMEMPVEWLSFRGDNKTLHLLSYSFLFRPVTLVSYFRAINFSTMTKSFENAQVVYQEAQQFTEGVIPVYGLAEILTTMRPLMARCFVLTIRRDNVLTDAFDQIWRRQRRELIRPLKVLMGQDEGERGIDHGGVQQEFFRVLMAEALDPGYGMFTIDERTRMTWFQPGSLEPLYKFEVLGVLVSIAVYNAITLPITFPLAFYRKLLGLKVKHLNHIKDGWPDLAKGMKEMIDWDQGDVGDVFLRTYEFSYELYGTHVDVDMEKVDRSAPWPPVERKKGKEKAKTTSFEFPPSPHLTPPDDLSPMASFHNRLSPNLYSDIEINGISTPGSVKTDILDSEAALVTNANRDRFVKDYIFWLTDKSIRPQYEAFAKGFYTCLDRTALSIFTAEALKSVIEGHEEIDIDGLEKCTTYEDGFTAESATVRDFWRIVRNYSPAQHRQLLEFVTASDRVPVNGIGSVVFIVQKNGRDDTRLPTSMTCFGRLLLPEYSTAGILEEKLSRAIENSKGFGVA